MVQLSSLSITTRHPALSDPRPRQRAEMPLTASQKAAVQTFVTTTGGSEKTAQRVSGRHRGPTSMLLIGAFNNKSGEVDMSR